MKKILLMLLSLLIVASMLYACDASDVADKPKVSDNGSNKDTGDEISTIDKAASKGLRLVPISNVVEQRYVPSAVNAESITEEECRLLAMDMYREVLAIAEEFYGVPCSLLRPSGVPYPAGEIVYSEVNFFEDENKDSPIEFKNDPDHLRSVVEKYFTDRLVESAFNLEYPCPIYEENGVLYRTGYETGSGQQGLDIAAGRILSRENGIVRYIFPIYHLDFETNDPDNDFWFIGYMDFAFEGGQWKVDDFRFSGIKYSREHFPGGNAVEIRMDDYFDEGTTETFGEISVSVSGGKNAVCSFGEKSINIALGCNSSNIESIEKIDGNIFISFLGVFGENEVVVISESEGSIISQFSAQTYTVTEDGWYYVNIDRANKACIIYNENNEALRECSAVVYEDAFLFTMPAIAPIEKIEVTEEEILLTYNDICY